MGLLKDLYEEMAQPLPHPEPQDYARVLDRLLDFLKSDERLPEVIRVLADQTWRWVTAGKLEVVVDPDMEAMTFMHFSVGEFSGASLLLPEGFLELVQNDTPRQLGALMTLCQKAENHLKKRRKKTKAHGPMMEAILLHSLAKIHEEEGIAYEWNEQQKALLKPIHGSNQQEHEEGEK